MIAEGPGGGHYDILTNRDYTKVACGIYVGHGVQTITIDFFYWKINYLNCSIYSLN